MLERTAVPQSSELIIPNLIVPDVEKLNNGLQVSWLEDKDLELVKVDLLFKVGSKSGEKKILPVATSALLLSGTKDRTASEISADIDFYGAFFNVNQTTDYTVVSVHVLREYLLPVLESVVDAISNVAFPSDEVSTYADVKKQKLLVGLQKVSVMAKRRLGEQLFGSNHPYGRSIDPIDTGILNKEVLNEFYTNNFKNSLSAVFIAGGVSSSEKTIIKNLLSNEWSYEAGESENGTIGRTIAGFSHVDMNSTVQTGLRVGRQLFDKNDSDYFGMKILNVILGGYFGSRLMANIREDKGYTYGIHSGIVNFIDTGYMYIATEVGADVTKDAVREIQKELELLQKEPVTLKELDLVKNYMLGSFMRNLDGIFSISDWYNMLYQYDLDSSFHEKYLNSIRNITPEEVQNLARKYLIFEDFSVVSAGSVSAK